MERWGEEKENRYLLAALSTARRNENEIVEEFNKIYNHIVERLHIDIKPLDVPILIYYLDALDGELNFQLRQRSLEPQSCTRINY
jgi:hypothetical protein